MSSVKDRKLYQKFVDNYSIYIVIKNDKMMGRLIVRLAKNGDDVAYWTDYSNHENDAIGRSYWFRNTMNGMKFDGHDFVDGIDPIVQMRAWRYTVETVIC